MSEKIQHTLLIPNDLGGLRLDQALAKLLPQYSRTQIQNWIKNGEIHLEGAIPKTRINVIGGETVTVNATLKAPFVFEAQAIPLNIIFEDETLLVINKPPGMVVHPAIGNRDNTLLNA